MKIFRSIGTALEMIKWEHSVFALPFAFCGAMLAAQGVPSGRQVLWIVVAMVSARSAAMAFNRLIDLRFDAANPRTRSRALVTGALTRTFVAVFTILACGVFLLASARLNRLCLLLSPLALIVVFFYSFTKRFTRWSHLILGFALGIAPAAAWIAIRGALDFKILILTAAVTFWVAGFDVLYACQDFEFDRSSGLFSLPSSFGISGAFAAARIMHFAMMVLLLWLVAAFGLGRWAIAGIAIVAILLAYEHSLVSPRDLRRLNAAFFTMNGVISMVFFFFLAADLLAGR